MNACQVVSSPWANAAVVATFLGALTFVVLYAWSTRGAWWSSTLGRNVMTLMGALLVVASLAVAALIWGTNWPYRDAIRTAAWTVIAVPIWWRVAILIRVQRPERTPPTR